MFCSKYAKRRLAAMIWNITRSRWIELSRCLFQEGIQSADNNAILYATHQSSSST
jgi:hypothetical protein